MIRAFLLLLACVVSARAITLVENGQSRYRIVISANAIASERYAADELQRYLEKISGAKLPIVTDAEKLTDYEILLGDNTRAPRNPDGFTLRTDRNRLVIAGGRPRGTLYGVYALLEEKFGVRWFTPDCEVVPKLTRIALPALNETQVPPLEYREVFWSEMLHNADFAARHRLNGANYRLTDKHGGRAVVYHPFVHSFDALVPPALFKEHPEYFPEIKGKRVSGYVQRCLSNPDVLKLAIAGVRRWIKEHPDANIISVSQNDTINNCQCAQCKALDDAEGTPAASLLKFVNAIAADIERDYPNVRLDTLAYQYTRKPPKTIRPRRNVIIRLCSIECCFAHPLDTCPSKENQRFRDDIIAWQPVAPLLYVWDYTTDFAHYQQPFPNFDTLQPNVQFFVKHGVKGLFEQGNYSGGGHGEMEPLRAYLLAKLLWNPSADVKRHTDEFLAGYYGANAGKLRAYLDLLQSQVRGKEVHAHIFDGTKAAYLNDNFIAAADKLLDSDDPRLEVAHLPVWYVQLATKRDAPLKRFLAVAHRAGISNISEGQALDAWAKKMGAE